jgi:hypothetical protein
MKAISLGAFVVALEGYEEDIAKKMYLVMWKCRGDNVNCLVTKSEMAHFENKLKALAVVERVESAPATGASLAASQGEGAITSIRNKCTIQ